MKKCKYCKSEIEKDAKICPNCRKNQNSNNKVLTVLGIFVFMAIAIGISTSNENNEQNNNANNENTTTTIPTYYVYNIGDKITIDDVDYIVEDKSLKDIIYDSSGYLYYTPKGTYLLIKIKVTNNSKSPLNIDSSDFTLKDEYDAKYTPSALVGAKYEMFNFTYINPNQTHTGYIAYDIADTTLQYTLTIKGNSWHSLSKKVKIQ